MADSASKPDLDAIKNVLGYARLAPSSHNTQPWTVTYTDSGLDIGYDTGRQLTVGDPEKRELFISLGCFIESIFRAAPAFGLTAVYSFVGAGPEQVAHIAFEGGGASAVNWLDYMQRRRSDRRFYDRAPLTADTSQALRGISSGLAYMHLVDQPEDIDFLAAATEQATKEMMSPQAFRDELAHWVRNNWTRQPDGMPGYCQGIPGPVSLLAKLVIRKTGQATKDQAKKDGARVAHSAAIGLICVKEQSPAAWIDAGRVYMTACLLALQSNLKTAGTSAAVVSTDTNRQICERFKLDDAPVALLRVGIVAGMVRATPRRSVEALTAN